MGWMEQIVTAKQDSLDMGIIEADLPRSRHRSWHCSCLLEAHKGLRLGMWVDGDGRGCSDEVDEGELLGWRDGWRCGHDYGEPRVSASHR